MSLFNTLRFIITHPLNRAAPLAAVGRFLHWQLKSRLTTGPILVDFVEPMRLAVSRQMYGATQNIYCDLHEYEEMAFALHFLRPGDLFVDVGANIGSYSLLAAAAKADVIAFEPGERFNDLMRNLSVNGLSAETHKAAVGSFSGTLPFTIGLDCLNRPAMAGEKSVEVAVVRLDDAVHRDPALIKIDVEGYEAAVLAGGARTISSAKAVIMEINGQTARYGNEASDILRQMQAWGFRHVGYDPVARKLTPPSERDNKIFVRDEVSERLRTAPAFRTPHHVI